MPFNTYSLQLFNSRSINKNALCTNMEWFLWMKYLIQKQPKCGEADDVSNGDDRVFKAQKSASCIRTLLTMALFSNILDGLIRNNCRKEVC